MVVRPCDTAEIIVKILELDNAQDGAEQLSVAAHDPVREGQRPLAVSRAAQRLRNKADQIRFGLETDLLTREIDFG